MFSMLNDLILSLMIFTPLVFGVGLLGIKNVKIARTVAMFGAFLTFLWSLHVWFYFDGSQSGLQFVEAYEWLPALGIKYIVGIDGLSLLLVMLTTFLTILILISQWHVVESRQRYFLSLFMFLETGMLGALLAFDMVFFYLFWEAMLIPMYFIIGIWGSKERIYAANKFFIYTVVGSLFLLVAAILMYIEYHSQFGVYSTSLIDLYKVKIPYPQQIWYFLAFAVAFAIKVPMWPFHTWLPDAHVQAPTAGSVVLAGILLKLGTYGFLRFALPLFPEATEALAPAIMLLGIIGILYGAFTAWVQEDAKKLVAYSSVSHLGFVVLGCVGFYAGAGEMSVEALTGSVYQMINHGISTGALFFLVGMIYERCHTRDLKEFGGLAKVMPWYAVMLIIATLSSVGLPGTGGFVGEFLILLGMFQVYPIVSFAASLGVLFGAVYMLSMVKRILFGNVTKADNEKLADLNGREFLYITPLAVLIFVMGIFPNIFLDKVKVSVEYFAKNYRQYEVSVVENHLDSPDSKLQNTGWSESAKFHGE